MSGEVSKIIIAGGGVAALETLFGLAEAAPGRFEAELVCPNDEFIYTPMTVAEPFSEVSAPRFEIQDLIANTGARRVPDAVVRVDTERQIVWTTIGEELHYDVLVLAVGARKTPVIENALTFGGPEDRERFTSLLQQLESGEVDDLAFVVPSGLTWALPLYELAMLTADWLHERGIDAGMTLLTPEQVPLRLFGLKASHRVARMLSDRGILLMPSTHVAQYDGRELALVPGGHLPAQKVVAVPRLEGPRIPGLPHDASGFLRIDGNGLVDGMTDVYAAGDGTSFPVKQGAIATQQADAIVEAIAASLGAGIEPTPFRPVMRGLMMSSDGPTFMKAEIAGGSGDSFEVSGHALWESADKVPGRYLSEHLATTESANSG